MKLNESEIEQEIKRYDSEAEYQTSMARRVR
jgi:hypothetical protein